MRRHLLVVILVTLVLAPHASGQFPHSTNRLGGNGTEGEQGHRGLAGAGGAGGQPSADSAMRDGQAGGDGGNGGDGGDGGDGGSGTWFISGTVFLGTFCLNVGGNAGDLGYDGWDDLEIQSGSGGDGGFANWPGFAAGEDGTNPDGFTDTWCGQGSTATGYPGGDAVGPNRGGGGGSSGPGVMSQITSAGGAGSNGVGDSGGDGADGFDGQSESFWTLSTQYVIVPQDLIVGGDGGEGGASGQRGLGGGGGGGAGGAGTWPAGLGGAGGFHGQHGAPGAGGAAGIGLVVVSSGGVLNNQGLVVIAAQSQVKVSDAGSNLDNQAGILVLAGGSLLIANEGLLDNAGHIEPEPDDVSTVRLQAGGRLHNRPTAVVNCWIENEGGRLQNDGAAHICQNGGEVTGGGSFELIVNNGLVAPGDGVGTLTALAGYSGSGVLRIEIAGLEDHDVLSVGGELELVDETLDLAFVGGFDESDLAWGDAFDIVRYGSPSERTGTFAAVVDSLADLAQGIWELDYDHELVPGELYSIRLVYAQDPNPVPDPELPSRYALHGPYPNPFNPRTTIRFDLPQTDTVLLEVFDMAGRRVWRRGFAEPLPAGRHEVTWGGTDRVGRALPSGTYLVRLQTGSFQRTRRMALLR
jgi:hypothetical protein